MEGARLVLVLPVIFQCSVIFDCLHEPHIFDMLHSRTTHGNSSPCNCIPFSRGELMDTSLQHMNLTADELSASLAAKEAEEGLEEEHHIHLPNPSLWTI